MDKKIERTEIDFESRDKQFMELQGLYKQLMELQRLHNSQLMLIAELGDKLVITEKKLRETEYALNNLEKRHRQANATIKEKEYLISNLLESEQLLVERAFELRTELENANVHNLYIKK